MASFGKKQMEQLSGFLPTLLSYGMGLIITTIYITEWKPVCKFIPFFNKSEKFQDTKK